MRNKVRKIANQISECASKWQGIKAIILGEAAEIGIYDPYFQIDLDVYYQDNLPDLDYRKKCFQEFSAFDVSLSNSLDYFLINNLPVILHYINITIIEEIKGRIQNNRWAAHENGTKMFYRIKNGEIIYAKDQWIQSLKKWLDHLPLKFWRILIDDTRFSVEKSLSDLGAAVFRHDDLFYLSSAGKFISNICRLLFAINKKFEPSGRMLFNYIKKLKKMPDEFLVRFESFIRCEKELPPARKREIAELMTKSILHMH